jgi:hypothetical protein
MFILVMAEGWPTAIGVLCVCVGVNIMFWDTRQQIIYRRR